MSLSSQNGTAAAAPAAAEFIQKTDTGRGGSHIRHPPPGRYQVYNHTKKRKSRQRSCHNNCCSNPKIFTANKLTNNKTEAEAEVEAEAEAEDEAEAEVEADAALLHQMRALLTLCRSSRYRRHAAAVVV
jgi:hypothetical protein